jgi:hypothetical protein
MASQDRERKRVSARKYRIGNREKRNAYNRRYQASHPEKFRIRRRTYYTAHSEKIRTDTRKRREKHRAIWMRIVSLAGKDQCLRCGYSKCFNAIDFHHRDPKQKKMIMAKIFGQPVTPERIAELERCDALCRNCHTELHVELKTIQPGETSL